MLILFSFTVNKEKKHLANWRYRSHNGGSIQVVGRREVPTEEQSELSQHWAGFSHIPAPELPLFVISPFAYFVVNKFRAITLTFCLLY